MKGVLKKKPVVSKYLRISKYSRCPENMVAPGFKKSLNIYIILYILLQSKDKKSC